MHALGSPAPKMGGLDPDHDGRLDIYCYLSDGDEDGSSVLFLSSKGEKGKLVKKVAEFWTPGC